MRVIRLCILAALMSGLAAAQVKDVAAVHAPYHARVEVQADTPRTIHSGDFVLGTLDRQRYFRSYHPLGIFSEARNRELDELGATPARGTFSLNLDPDPARPGQPTAKSLAKALEQHRDAYRRARQAHPGLPHAIAHGNYPRWMRPRAQTPSSSDDKRLREDWELYFSPDNTLDRAYFERYASYLSQWYAGLKRSGGYPPPYLTVQNEPTNTWKVDDYAAYSRLLAERMHRDHPGVKVCGPCSAWAYPTADWTRWFNYEKPYIEQAGTVLDAYDMHFYSKAHWALPPTPEWQARRFKDPSMFVNQYQGNATVWDFGRLDAYLDLFAAYHMQAHGVAQPKPMIVSEFGNQTLHPQFGPWTNDFKYWLYMTTVARMWLTFMERPEVQLTVPFILGESDAGHAPQRGQAIYTRPGAPKDLSLHATPFRKFYQFFKDLGGQRVTFRVSGDDPRHGRDLLAQAFREGNALYLLLHNRKGFPYYACTVDLSVDPGRDAEGRSLTIARREIKRLYYEGEIPEPHDKAGLEGTLRIDTEYQPLASLEKVALHPEEVAIVKLTLSGSPWTRGAVAEYWAYATPTMVDIKPAVPHKFTVVVPPIDGAIHAAWVQVGLARDGGFGVKPLVSVNGGVVADFDPRGSLGIKDFHALERGNVPDAALRTGRNEITVTFPAGTPLDGHPKISSVKLITAVAGES